MSHPIWLEVGVEAAELARDLASMGTDELIRLIKDIDEAVGDQLFTEELIAALHETLEGVE